MPSLTKEDIDALTTVTEEERKELHSLRYRMMIEMNAPKRKMSNAKATAALLEWWNSDEFKRGQALLDKAFPKTT